MNAGSLSKRRLRPFHEQLEVRRLLSASGYGQSFVTYTDSTRATPGLVGSYVNQSLAGVDQLDWRTGQSVAGTRTEDPFFASNDWGVRSSVGVTGGSDADWDQFSVQWDGVVDLLDSNMTLAVRTENSRARMWIDTNSDGVFSGGEQIDGAWGAGHGGWESSISSPQLSTGTYAIRIQYEEQSGPNRFGLVSNLITPTPYSHTVRIGYLVPNNRTPQHAAIDNIQDFLPRMQDWFAEQLDRHGFGEKSITYETQSDGTPVIHTVHLGVEDSFLRDDIWGNTLVAALTAGVTVWAPGEVWFLIPEAHIQNSDTSISGGAALGGSFGSGSDPGVAMIGSDTLFALTEDALLDNRPYAGEIVPEVGPLPLVQGVAYPWFMGDTFSSVASSFQGAIMHEVAHAFGLSHDFRNDGNFHGDLMGNGLRGYRGSIYPKLYPSEDMRLSKGAAEVLNVSRYFNPNMTYTDNTGPVVGFVGQSNIPVDGLLEVSFATSDASELAVAILRRDGQVIDEMPLSGTLFNGEFRTPYYNVGQSVTYQVSVYDEFGNRQNNEITLQVPAGYNQAPQPFVRVAHSNSLVGETIVLDASQSTDPDGSGLFVEWDTDGDGVFDTPLSSNLVTTISPSTPSTFFISARVTDLANDSAVSSPIAIRVSALPDSVGVRRGNRFIFDSNISQSEDPLDDTATFGQVGDAPVVGDWNGDGVDDLGVYRGRRFILDLNGNEIWDGPGVDGSYLFGNVGDVPVVGDWDGDGTDNIGVRRGNRFLIDLNGNGKFDGGGVDLNRAFGRATDTPIIGDWNGDGVDDFGVRRRTRFILDLNGNRLFDPGIDANRAFGQVTDTPVSGDWNADGIDEIGVRRSARFILDMNGNLSWDGPVTDANFAFGLATDLPIVGMRDASQLISQSVVPPVTSLPIQGDSDDDDIRVFDYMLLSSTSIDAVLSEEFEFHGS